MLKNISIILLLILLSNSGRQQASSGFIENSPVSKENTSSSSIQILNPRAYSDSEIIQNSIYSAPNYPNIRSQRRISYIDASASFFIKILLTCYSFRQRVLTDISLKCLSYRGYPFCMYPSQYYVFTLKKIVV